MNIIGGLLLLCVLVLLVKRRSRCSDPRVGAFLRKLKRHTYKLIHVLDPSDPRTERIKQNWSGKLGEMEHEENRRAFRNMKHNLFYIA